MEFTLGGLIPWIITVIVIVILIKTMIQISPMEKGVKERLSQYVGALDSGRHIVVPFLETVRKIDMRERVIKTDPQEMITKDNAVVTVDAVIFTQITDPAKSIYQIQDAFYAVSNLSITSLRAIIGTMTLDEVLGERAKINTQVQTELSIETSKRGITINKLEIQRIDPPKELMDAMNQQKIAQQQKRAQILKAEGLKEAAIQEAEGIKQKQIIEAQGQAESIEALAVARAKAVELESVAAMTYFKDAAITKEQLRVVEESLKNNTKYVIDTELLQSIKKIINPGG